MQQCMEPGTRMCGRRPRAPERRWRRPAAVGAGHVGSPAVRIGIYFDLRNPPRWARDWSTVYGEALELCEQAEAWGIDNVWASEHHHFEDGYLTQPLAFLTAVAARTKRVRLGTAVLLAALRHPLHVAEEAAIVDILSGGRLDLGVGAGYRIPEYESFDTDITKRYGLTDQRVRDIRDWLHGGKMTPPPVQDPLPIWLGYQGPQGATRAGRLGAGLLSLDRALLEPYRQGLGEGGHDPDDARMTGLLNIVVTDDPDASWPRIREHLAYQLDTYRAYGTEGTGLPPPRPVDPDRWRQTTPTTRVLPQFQLLTPDDAVTAILDATDGLPAVGCHLWASIAAMPTDLVQRNVELLATVVAPAVRAARG
jgi:alkanesulfonate monooxygenase SsuD/methylene tetrahydromethanopterin reductase-like flavin-dependent oxidoreductase (luciferase family)